MNNVLQNKPKASEANNEKTQNVFTMNICLAGNHTLANLFAELSIKQKPIEVIKVPNKKK